MESWEFTAELWRAESTGSWVFVAVPPELSEEIRMCSGPPVGFGSVRVTARIGATTWQTSVFPDSKRGCFVLPVKKPVRRAEDLEVGADAEVVLALPGSRR
ncbi:MAG: DUF1905 domain-containing protein [Nocardioides sp.]